MARNRNKAAIAATGSLRATTQSRGTRMRSSGIGTDRAVVKSSFVEIVTVGAGGTFHYVMTPSNYSVASSSVRAIAGAYEFFKIRSLSVEYVPINGSTAPGGITWAFVDNPETMRIITQGLNKPEQRGVINSTQGVESYSLAYPTTKTFNSNRIKSREWYGCNVTPNNTVDDLDRSIPCMLVGVVDKALFDVEIIGNFVFHITFEFRGLGSSANTTLRSVAETMAGVAPRVQYPYPPPFPDSLTMVSFDGKAEYVLKPTPEPTPPTPLE